MATSTPRRRALDAVATPIRDVHDPWGSAHSPICVRVVNDTRDSQDCAGVVFAYSGYCAGSPIQLCKACATF